MAVQPSRMSETPRIHQNKKWQQQQQRKKREEVIGPAITCSQSQPMWNGFDCVCAHTPRRWTAILVVGTSRIRVGADGCRCRRCVRVRVKWNTIRAQEEMATENFANFRNSSGTEWNRKKKKNAFHIIPMSVVLPKFAFFLLSYSFCKISCDFWFNH